jgi:hypothetical protein
VRDALSDDDPGWPISPSLLLLLVPGAAARYMRRSAGKDGLVLLRTVFLTFSISVVLIGVVIAVIGNLPNGPVVPWVPILVAVAVACVIGNRLTEKPLDCSSPTALAASFRTRFFVRVAFAETVAMFAFVITFIGGPVWTYDAGAAFTRLRLWTVAAPTRRALAGDQAELDARRCRMPLTRTLRDVIPPPRATGRV